MDVSAEKMIFGVAGIDPQRRAELIKVLDIDLSWRMHKVSDGQRRRVQICMGLLRPFKALLLDEITVDLNVLARADLLKFLKKKCEECGATIIYATHIFDGLENWPSHIRTVESWLRKERDEERKRRKERKASGIPEFEEQVEGSHVNRGSSLCCRSCTEQWLGCRKDALHSCWSRELLLKLNRVLR